MLIFNDDHSYAYIVYVFVNDTTCAVHFDNALSFVGVKYLKKLIQTRVERYDGGIHRFIVII